MSSIRWSVPWAAALLTCTPSWAMAQVGEGDGQADPMQIGPADGDDADGALGGTLLEDDASTESDEQWGGEGDFDSTYLGGEGGPAPLQLSGFADFTYAALIGVDDTSWPDAYLQAPSFYIGNLNIYLNAELSDRIRSLVEVRFMYLPQGQLSSEGEPLVLEDLGAATPGALGYTDTRASDYSEFGRDVTWGGIRIERAWAEYSFGPHLTVRGGQWLTPYGIWNVDHGSPTIVAVRRPLVVSQALFPEHQTGIQLHGRAYAGASTFGYALTLSNGRGPIAEYQDLDKNKAVGGRLTWQYTGKFDLELGASAYRGRYTERDKELEIAVQDGGVDVNLVSPIRTQFEEVSLGADLRFRYRGLLVQGEVLMNDVAFTPGHRPPATRSLEPNGVLADYRTGGFYVLTGFRTPWVGLMPYVNIDTHSYAEQDYLDRGVFVNVGINWRLEPNFVIKAEYGALYFDSLTFSTIRNGLVQVAWAF
jgi:hypothetical protein